ncbi:uncharacterized protein LOC144438768 [Glandiceps talaboti]
METYELPPRFQKLTGQTHRTGYVPQFQNKYDSNRGQRDYKQYGNTSQRGNPYYNKHSNQFQTPYSQRSDFHHTQQRTYEHGNHPYGRKYHDGNAREQTNQQVNSSENKTAAGGQSYAYSAQQPKPQRYQQTSRMSNGQAAQRPGYSKFAVSSKTKITVEPLPEGSVLCLLRGPPGSGKTTLARKLMGDDGIVLSTDEFFVNYYGRYEFNFSKLGEAHEWNRQRAKTAMEAQIAPIIIDNTNCQIWEMKPYASLAMLYKYSVVIREPDTPWCFKVRELAQRNTHHVPAERIQKFIDRYERNVTAEKLLAAVGGRKARDKQSDSKSDSDESQDPSTNDGIETQDRDDDSESIQEECGIIDGGASDDDSDQGIEEDKSSDDESGKVQGGSESSEESNQQSTASRNSHSRSRGRKTKKKKKNEKKGKKQKRTDASRKGKFPRNNDDKENGGEEPQLLPPTKEDTKNDSKVVVKEEIEEMLPVDSEMKQDEAKTIKKKKKKKKKKKTVKVEEEEEEGGGKRKLTKEEEDEMLAKSEEMIQTAMEYLPPSITNTPFFQNKGKQGFSITVRVDENDESEKRANKISLDLKPGVFKDNEEARGGTESKPMGWSDCMQSRHKNKRKKKKKKGGSGGGGGSSGGGGGGGSKEDADVELLAFPDGTVQRVVKGEYNGDNDDDDDADDDDDDDDKDEDDDQSDNDDVESEKEAKQQPKEKEGAVSSGEDSDDERSSIDLPPGIAMPRMYPNVSTLKYKKPKGSENIDYLCDWTQSRAESQKEVYITTRDLLKKKKRELYQAAERENSVIDDEEEEVNKGPVFGPEKPESLQRKEKILEHCKIGKYPFYHPTTHRRTLSYILCEDGKQYYPAFGSKNIIGMILDDVAADRKKGAEASEETDDSEVEKKHSVSDSEEEPKPTMVDSSSSTESRDFSILEQVNNKVIPKLPNSDWKIRKTVLHRFACNMKEFFHMSKDYNCSSSLHKSTTMEDFPYGISIGDNLKFLRKHFRKVTDEGLRETFTQCDGDVGWCIDTLMEIEWPMDREQIETKIFRKRKKMKILQRYNRSNMKVHVAGDVTKVTRSADSENETGVTKEEVSLVEAKTDGVMVKKEKIVKKGTSSKDGETKKANKEFEETTESEGVNKMKRSENRGQEKSSEKVEESSLERVTAIEEVKSTSKEVAETVNAGKDVVKEGNHAGDVALNKVEGRHKGMVVACTFSELVKVDDNISRDASDAKVLDEEVRSCELALKEEPQKKGKDQEIGEKKGKTEMSTSDSKPLAERQSDEQRVCQEVIAKETLLSSGEGDSDLRREKNASKADSEAAVKKGGCGETEDGCKAENAFTSTPDVCEVSEDSERPCVTIAQATVSDEVDMTYSGSTVVQNDIDFSHVMGQSLSELSSETDKDMRELRQVHSDESNTSEQIEETKVLEDDTKFIFSPEDDEFRFSHNSADDDDVIREMKAIVSADNDDMPVDIDSTLMLPIDLDREVTEADKYEGNVPFFTPEVQMMGGAWQPEMIPRPLGDTEEQYFSTEEDISDKMEESDKTSEVSSTGGFDCIAGGASRGVSQVSERLRDKADGGPEATAVLEENLQMPIDPIFALQLQEMFGPVQLSPSAVSAGLLPHEDYSVTIGTELAKQIYMCWVKTLARSHRHQEEIEKMIKSDEALARELQREEEMRIKPKKMHKSRPHHPTSSSNSSSPSSSRSASPVKRYVPMRMTQPPTTPPKPFFPPKDTLPLKEIMDEQMAIQISQDDRNAAKEEKREQEGMATKLKREKLRALFPTVDQEALDEIFEANKFELTPTMYIIKSSLGLIDGPESQVPSTAGAAAAPVKPKPTFSSYKPKDFEAERYVEEEELYQTIDEPGYKDFRVEADLHYKERQKCFEKAAEAYRRKQGHLAIMYSQQGHMHTAKLWEANKRASEKIFRYKNTNLLEQNILDLHGLHVDEALDALELTIADKEAERVTPHRRYRTHLTVVTGRGTHSQGGKARLRPKVIDWLKRKDYQFTEPSAAMVKVLLKASY